jgi:hypothetical protein
MMYILALLLCLFRGGESVVGTTGHLRLRADVSGTLYTSLFAVGGVVQKSTTLRVDSAGSVSKLSPSTLSQGTLRCDGDGHCRDIVYLHDVAFYFNFTRTASGEVLALGPESDIWQHFSWAEYCPMHAQIVLHTAADGAFDVRQHDCGGGRPEEYTLQLCEDIIRCGGVETGHFRAWNGTHAAQFTEYQAYDDEVLCLGIPANILQSWILLCFFFYLVSDRVKDLSIMSTRIPLVVGNLTAAIISINIHSNYVSYNRRIQYVVL